MPDEAQEALIREILPALEIDHQYVRVVEEWNHDLVADVRRCGRAAARRLGYRVRTFASDPTERHDRRIVVWVVITHSNPVEEQRLRERGDLLANQILSELL